MEVKYISPAGYCYGVVDAMVITKNAAMDKRLPRPIYILGMIVHNEHVTKSFEHAGVYTVDGPNRLAILEKIDKGTVIFTAHGVSDVVRKRALEKGLTVIDASCPDVMITHAVVKSRIERGDEVIYIGKSGHPEPEGVMGIHPYKIHLVSQLSDVDALLLTAEQSIFVTNQTTMSQWDVADIMEAILKKYPHAEVHKDICRATLERQKAVAEQARGCDLTIVVGDPRSNNTRRLAQVSIEQAGVPSFRVADVSEIDPSWFKGVKKVAVTAGASTPTAILREVIAYLEHFDGKKTSSIIQPEDILPRGKARDLTKKRQRRMQELRKGNR